MEIKRVSLLLVLFFAPMLLSACQTTHGYDYSYGNTVFERRHYLERDFNVHQQIISPNRVYRIVGDYWYPPR